MSTAKNHAKRSHRSHYKSRIYSGSRRTVVKPSSKKTFAQFIRKLFKRKSERKDEK